VEYLIDLLNKLRERSPAGFDRVQYVEQPTARDLRANPQNRMHAAAKLKPVVIDESLTDYGSLILAREMGYTGVALKACKGQSQSLLLAAAAQSLGLFLCVQDLTCPARRSSNPRAWRPIFQASRALRRIRGSIARRPMWDGRIAFPVCSVLVTARWTPRALAAWDSAPSDGLGPAAAAAAGFGEVVADADPIRRLPEISRCIRRGLAGTVVA